MFWLGRFARRPRQGVGGGWVGGVGGGWVRGWVCARSAYQIIRMITSHTYANTDVNAVHASVGWGGVGRSGAERGGRGGGGGGVEVVGWRWWSGVVNKGCPRGRVCVLSLTDRHLLDLLAALWGRERSG